MCARQQHEEASCALQRPTWRDVQVPCSAVSCSFLATAFEEVAFDDFTPVSTLTKGWVGVGAW